MIKKEDRHGVFMNSTGQRPNGGTHSLFIRVTDIISIDWSFIPALLVIARARRLYATHNKGGLQFRKANTGEKGKQPKLIIVKIAASC